MQMVKVRVRKATRVYTFACNGIDLKPRDNVVVKSDRGLEYGTCLTLPEECEDAFAKRLQLQVVRKASSHDDLTHKQIMIEEENAGELCARKIREHGLPMKFVDVEYTLDRRKIVFYFTAEDRVDFRRLVRDLAHELKTRIELRHIQVRDEAKFLGGLGPCGMELCCRRWLCEFAPISMKMAKRQNLSLNPEKISGQCGRLMCCLSYEYDTYPTRRQQREAEQAREAEREEREAREAESRPAPRPERKCDERRPAAAGPPPRKEGSNAQQGEPREKGEGGNSPPDRKKRRRKKRRGKKSRENSSQG